MLAYESVQDISLLTRAAAIVAGRPAPYARDWSDALTLAAYAIEMGVAGEWEVTLVRFAKCVVLSAGAAPLCYQCMRPVQFCACTR